jgi:5-methylcytosine-specific restriction endonuclease McrA
MGKHVHKLSKINKEHRTAVCSNCGEVSLKTKGKAINGSPKWGCSVAKRQNKSPWLKHRKETCERCGFIPEHISQLDVDHIDGNKTNHSLSNLQTLCANCHRLKTVENKDSFNIIYR